MIFLYLLISVMPLERHPLWTRFWGELTVIKYLGIACVLYGIVHMCVRRSPPHFFRTVPARVFAVLVIIATASFVTSSEVAKWQTHPIMSYVSYVTFFFAILSLVDSLQRLRWVLLASMGSVAFASLYVVAEWVKYHNLYAGYRPGWVTGDPNYFSLSALLCLPLCFCWMAGLRPWWERLFACGCLVLTLVALILGASRGGFLGLGVVTIILLLRSRAPVRNSVMLGAVVVPLVLAVQVGPVRRLLHPDEFDQVAASTRLGAWHAGLHMVEAHPITGVGLGNFKSLSMRYGDPTEIQGNRIAHNTYVELAAEVGIPGLLTFLALLVSSFFLLEKVLRTAKRHRLRLLQLAAVGLQTGLIGYAVSAFFVSAEYQKLFWLLVFLAMCLPPLAERAADNRSSAVLQESSRKNLPASASLLPA